MLFLRYRNVILPIPIERIIRNPGAYDGKSVLVQGRVKGAAAIGPYGGYSLDDDTGSILVITDAGTPEIGRAVHVRGLVKRGLVVEGTSLLVIVEKRF